MPLHTSLLNIKRAEGYQTSDGASDMKDRDQKKLKKKMNSGERAIQREKTTSKKIEQKQQIITDIIKEMKEDTMDMR